MNKRLILIFVSLLLCSLLLNNRVLASKNQQKLFPRTGLDFYILESEFSEGDFLTGDFQDLKFKKYDYKEIPCERPIKDRMISLRSKINIDPAYANENLYLVALPLDYPCNIYVNGALVFIRGDFKLGYTNREHSTVKILLSPDLLTYSDQDEIAIQLYPKEGETYPLSKVFISNAKDANNYTFYRNLLGPKLIYALSLCGFVFFIFYLIVYISRREYQKQQFLFFAFMNLFFVVSYSNNIFTHNFSNTFFLEKIARVGFPLFIFVGICFLLDYTNLFKNKKVLKSLLLVIYIPSTIMMLTPGSTTELINAYNSYPLISLIFGNLVLSTLTLLYFLKAKDLKSLFLFVVFLLNIIAGLHDGYYFAILKIKPYVLLTPISVFGINLIIFIILALDHSKLYHVALNSSRKFEKLNQELEVLVEKRTRKTLEYANMLEEANSTKDKFFSIIAHDLKNPFNTLIGYSDVLRSDFREYGQDEISQHLNIIYDTSIKGYNLLENLLQWSQSQTDKIIFEPTKINLHEIVAFCIEDIEHQSMFKDIDVINEVPEISNIIADKNLLKTILRNLINNAVKFTPRNGMISVSSQKVDEYIEIAVKDTGIGMSELEIQNLFKIDKIVSKPGTNKEKGSGLGLVLCKEFVDKHGGTIWVESESDLGSIFKFTIPRILHTN